MEHQHSERARRQSEQAATLEQEIASLRQAKAECEGELAHSKGARRPRTQRRPPALTTT